MDAAEFSRVSAELLELGERLKGLRDQRKDLDSEISELEAKVRPLVVRHAQMLADIVGNIMPTAPAPAPAPVQLAQPQNYAGSPPNMAPVVEEPSIAKAKIIRYLQNAEPGISAGDIAQALRLDVGTVRQVMHEMMTNGRG